MGDARKTRRLFVRLTEREAALLREVADEAGLSVSALVLGRCLGPDAGELPPAEDLARVWAELRAQGRNLNQIAEAANRLARRGREGDARELRHALSSALPPYLAALDEAGSLLGRWPA